MTALVAKSYIGLPQIGEIFYSGNKGYINVQMKNGNTKTVRAYDKKEYAKYYPDLVVKTEGKYEPADGMDHSNDIYFRTQKSVLGFDEGYIISFIGETFPHKDYLKSLPNAHFTRLFGWSVPGGQEIPEDLPEGISILKIEWDKVGNGEILKSDDEVISVVESLSYPEDDSKYVGTIGERLENDLMIEKIVELDGYWGKSKLYIMRDASHNCFSWTTQSEKDWEVGETYRIRGTLKEHKVFRNCKQNVLSRCNVVKAK